MGENGRKMGGATGLLALVLASAACSGVGDLFKEPDIQLDHVVVRGIGLTGGNLDLVVKVENFNRSGSAGPASAAPSALHSVMETFRTGCKARPRSRPHLGGRWSRLPMRGEPL